MKKLLLAILTLITITAQSETVAVFKGFENSRYQQHDKLILECVREFNINTETGIGGNKTQADTVRKHGRLTANLVKAWFIQESGGNDTRSLLAWNTDPAQVNVPNDFSEYKKDIGLTKPTKRNTGNIKDNIRASIKFLARKGFGVSGQPLRNRNGAGFFDGWEVAIERYNGRTAITTNGNAYRKNYQVRIFNRANNISKQFIALPKPVK